VNGNVALSVGLVFFSTVLSPFTTPIILHIVGWIAKGDYSEDLHELALHGTQAFLTFSVIIPSLVGMLVGQLLKRNITFLKLKPWLKLINTLSLLILIYANTALVLSTTFSHPNWSLFAMIAMVSFGLCLLAFSMGWFLPVLLSRLKLISSEPATLIPNQTAMMFGIGMNNNGTGLVLSSAALADHPVALLTIIFYNVVQQVVAGIFTQNVSETTDNLPDTEDETP
jgi:BASS family bile acid:Na+ symporter